MSDYDADARAWRLFRAEASPELITAELRAAYAAGYERGRAEALAEAIESICLDSFDLGERGSGWNASPRDVCKNIHALATRSKQ